VLDAAPQSLDKDVVIRPAPSIHTDGDAHAPNYLLKGALLFSLWYDLPHRPTRDADLLGFGSDDIDSAVAAFREICQIPAEDGIVFDPASVKGAVIRKEAGYGGVQIDHMPVGNG
jgi:hypothetical protein